MDNRANLLSCALQLFAARGYDAVSVKEVVDAAGVTKPTLYHYFGSKRGLLDTLLAERFAELYQVIEEAATYRGDLPLTLNRVTTAYFRYAKAQRLFYRMQLSMWFAPPDSDGFKAVSLLNVREQQILEAETTSLIQYFSALLPMPPLTILPSQQNSCFPQQCS